MTVVSTRKRTGGQFEASLSYRMRACLKEPERMGEGHRGGGENWKGMGGDGGGTVIRM